MNTELLTTSRHFPRTMRVAHRCQASSWPASPRPSRFHGCRPSEPCGKQARGQFAPTDWRLAPTTSVAPAVGSLACTVRGSFQQCLEVVEDVGVFVATRVAMLLAVLQSPCHGCTAGAVVKPEEALDVRIILNAWLDGTDHPEYALCGRHRFVGCWRGFQRRGDITLM